MTRKISEEQTRKEMIDPQLERAGWFLRDLRIQFTERRKREGRIRPFKNIIGANSRSEDGLQLADMVAGAICLNSIGSSSEHYRVIFPRIVDLWQVP